MLPLSWEATDSVTWSGCLELQQRQARPWVLSWVCLFQSSSYRHVIQVFKYKKRKKIKKTWPGLLSSSQASDAVSFAQDLPISVSCLGQGNTQGTHTGLAKVKVSNRHPVVCKSHPVEDPCSLFKRAWPPIATVQSQPSAHHTSGWRTDSHPKASLSCTSPQKCHEAQAAPPSSCSSGQHKGTTAPAR